MMEKEYEARIREQASRPSDLSITLMLREMLMDCLSEIDRLREELDGKPL